jgi:hypothetical protein
MKMGKVIIEPGESDTYFTLPIYAMDEFESRYRSYLCKWDGKTVFFMYGGRGANEPRPIRPAASLDDAIEKATVYMEAWLRKCGAI